jgi:hypothetical protein
MLNLLLANDHCAVERKCLRALLSVPGNRVNVLDYIFFLQQREVNVLTRKRAGTEKGNLNFDLEAGSVHR